MLRLFALLALVAAATANATFLSKTKCPKLIGMYPFDMQKFDGDWYLTAANPSILELQGKCGKMSFMFNKEAKEGSVMNSRYSGLSLKDNSPIAFESFVTPMFSEKAASFYTVFRAEGTSTYSAPYMQAIIASDYANYAVMAACRPVFDSTTKSFERYLYAGIFARQGITLSKDTIDALTTVLGSYNIDVTTIKPVETKC